MNNYEDEINLMEYLLVLWRRKWLIIIPSFLLATIAGVVNFMKTPVWEVDAIIQPSKLMVQTGQGELKEFIVIEPKQIVGQINQASYNQLIAARLSLDVRQMPRIQSENLKDTKLIRIWVRDTDIDRGKKIILTLFDILQAEFNNMSGVERKGIEIGIQRNENRIKEKRLAIKDKESELKILLSQKDMFRAKAVTDANKIEISNKMVESITKEMNAVKQSNEGLQTNFNNAIREARQEIQAMGILMYSTEVESNLRYMSTLNESASRERVTQETLSLSIKENTEKMKEQDVLMEKARNEILRINMEIEDIKKEIELLEGRKSRIDDARLIKDATSSFGPVSPRKVRSTAIVGFLTAAAFSVLAFFLEYLDKQKKLAKKPDSGI